MLTIHVLVVDDSIVFRKLVSEVLSQIKGIEVIGVAGGGKTAIEKIKNLKPDLITLDIEMPDFNGFQVIEEINRLGIKTDIIMVSSLNSRASKLTMKALEMGAFDFVLKPSKRTFEENKKELLHELEKVITVYQRRREIKEIFSSQKNIIALRKKTPISEAKPLEEKEKKLGLSEKEPEEKVRNLFKPRMVLIGVSTGGPKALSDLLPHLPNNLGVPVFIVQHMPPLFTKSLAENLNEKCAISVKEAENAEEAQPNTAYLAPGGKQMKLVSTSKGGIGILINDDPPERNCKPSANYLFRSAASEFPGKSVVVILTGMGDDGTLGLKLLKRYTCNAIAQNEETCVVFGMPKAAIETGLINSVLPLEKIPQAILAALGKQKEQTS
ncbi:MAG: chemotaxis response regulator protein-glutamate methylesterase [Candidatus Riflebacteria bacterium]|nr:chemotaxis response regulator protein-glutamate methylesterase [Candidatus Riflebacteria bacterium]